MPMSSDSSESRSADVQADRREALRRVIRLLPGSVQPYLVELYRESEVEASREAELYSALRSALNTLTAQGALPRRSFLQIAGLIVTGGLAPFLYPEKAQGAWQAWTGFWQNINNNSYVAPTNTGLDPYWDYVVLLMNFDGSSGSTVFVEESNVGKAPTINGAPYIDTSAGSSPFSGKTGSAKFNGSTDYVSFASSSAFNFGSSDFTIELWFKLAALPASSVYWPLVAQRASSQHAFDVGIYNSSGTYYLTTEISSSGSAITNSASATYSLSTGTWYHIAFVRQGTTLKTFVNGTQQGSSSFSGSVFSSSTALSVGYDTAATTYLNGSISDLRIYNGVAKYTAAFTPATAPIGLSSFNDPYWGYCVLACPFDGSLKDMSGSSCASNGPSLSSSVKKYGTASAAFNGSGQYLTCPNRSSWQLTGDFTIECFVYVNNVSGNQAIVQHKGNYGDYGWEMGFSSGVPTFYLSANGTSSSGIVGAAAISINTWYHLAVARSNGTVRLFQDGVLIGSMSNSNSSYASSTPLNIGRNVETNVWHLNGYIDSLRITNGYARYTSNFTPPSAAFPVGKDESVDPFWTNTVLALHLDDLTDATGRHVITANNSAATSTSAYKYGTASLSLNGSNQHLTTPASSDFTFGTADWTIEGWFYETSSSGSRTIFGFGDVSSGGCPVEIRTTTTTFDFWDDTSGGASATPAYSRILNVWRHFAVSKSNGTIRIFLGGVQIASTTASNTMPSFTASLYIGAVANGGPLNYFAGNLDDLRVTKGVARYTQNFTPPTRAFSSSQSSTAVNYDPFWSSVALLLHMDEANAAFTDSSGKTPVTNNSVTYSTSSKFGSGSGSFNGTSSYLSLPDSTDWDLSSKSSYTVEAWVNLNSGTRTSAAPIVANNNLSGGNPWVLYIDTNNKLNFYCYDTTYHTATSSASVPAGIWTHVAATMSGNNLAVYVNGVQSGTATKTGAIQSQSKLVVGRANSGEQFPGLIDEVRVTNGVVRYSGGFALQSSAFSSSAGIVTSGLVTCLDAGDATSYDGSSQTWKNMATSPADSSSQSAYDFYRGSSSSSESSDPTFIGVAGGRSANDYFSMNGSQYLTLAGSNTTFINSMHKSGAQYTLAAVVYNTGSGNNTVFADCSAGSASTGVLWYIHGSGICLMYFNGSSPNYFIGSTKVPSNTYAFMATSLNTSAGANGSFHYLNGNADLFNGVYSSPSSSNASNTAMIGSAADGYTLPSGSRVAWFAIYNRALTKAELDQTFAAVRGRFGI